MSITLAPERRDPSALPITTGSARLLPAGPALWRVVDRSGRVSGHIALVEDGGGTRYRARRYHSPTRSFRDLGDFWVCEQAIECLTFAR